MAYEKNYEYFFFEESGRVGQWVDQISTNSKEVHVKVGILPLFVFIQCIVEKEFLGQRKHKYLSVPGACIIPVWHFLGRVC